MQDSAMRAFRRMNKGQPTPKLSESRNPLIHLMYALRHINVHTIPLPSTVGEVTIIFQPTSEEIPYDAVMLTDVTIQDLLRSGEIRDFYEKRDLERSCEWLMEAQRVFGIAEVFSLGVRAYCMEIFTKYRE
jgi:hypothetical protein